MGLGDLLIDAAQRAPGAVVAALVVGDPIRDPAGALRTGGRPRLGQHQLIGHRFARVFVAPFAHHIGQEWNPDAQDVGQPDGRHGDLVGFGDHPGIGDHRHVGEIMGGLEGVDHRQHHGGLGFIALQRLDRQREPSGISEQP